MGCDRGGVGFDKKREMVYMMNGFPALVLCLSVTKSY